MTLSTLDIMAWGEVRAANEAGRAVAVLDGELATVLFANSMGAVLLGLPGVGGAHDTPLPEGAAAQRIRSLAPLLEDDGEAMLRLRGVAGEIEVWTTAHLLKTQIEDGMELALLTAPVPVARPESPSALASRLLAEAGEEAREGVIATAGEILARNESGTVESAVIDDGHVQAFLESDRAQAEEHGLLLWRIASGMALVLAAPEQAAEPLSADMPNAEHPIEPPAGPKSSLFRFKANLDAEPVRFVWQADAEGRLQPFPDAFAEVVGPLSADVAGVPFTEVAHAYSFDENGEIARLMERRETFAGRTVLWPVEGTDRKVPVDLAALPVYGRERVFEGFRGFAVVRPDENVADPDAIGLMLEGGFADRIARDEPAAEAAVEWEEEEEEHEEAVFGRRPSPPSASVSSDMSHIEERRRARDLSPAEEDAFRAIGAELAPEGSQAPRVSASATLPVDALALLAAMPLPLLVEMGGEIALANAELLALTGHPSVEALRRAGGIDALFADEEEAGAEDGSALRRADGTHLRARVQMRRVTLSGRSCLLFTFHPAAETAEPSAEDEALREENEELRTVLDTATDGVLLLDPDGHIRSMNGSAEAMFGAREGSLEGTHFADLLAPESRQNARDYLELLREEGLAGILNDGREVTAEVAGRGTIPLFITLGRLSGGRGWCMVLRDMAHWKEVEAELVAARRQAEDASLTKSRFLANIGHELRTPLNAIIGFADVMVSETYGPLGHERYAEYLRDIKRSGHHVLDLVNDLLDISKIEAGKVEMAFEAVSLNEVIAEVVSLMQPQASRRRVIMRSNLPADIPAVVADRRSVRQIALNLISNAIRFTPSGGQIIASTSYAENGEVSLRFRDSGIGMTDREIEIALTPFQQVNSAGAERGEGTGLGLPLTKAMVEANRAQFRIASAPGEGTLIEIIFPAQRVLAH